VVLALVAVVSALRLQAREIMQDAIDRLRVRAEYTHSLGPEHMHNIGNPYFSRPLLLSVKRYKWAITTIISDKEKVIDITLVFPIKAVKAKPLKVYCKGSTTVYL